MNFISLCWSQNFNLKVTLLNLDQSQTLKIRLLPGMLICQFVCVLAPAWPTTCLTNCKILILPNNKREPPIKDKRLEILSIFVQSLLIQFFHSILFYSKLFDFAVGPPAKLNVQPETETRLENGGCPFFKVEVQDAAGNLTSGCKQNVLARVSMSFFSFFSSHYPSDLSLPSFRQCSCFFFVFFLNNVKGCSKTISFIWFSHT